MNLAIAHNGDSLLPRLVPSNVELVKKRNTDDLWSFQWTKNRFCILLLSDYELCAWLKCGGSLNNLVKSIEKEKLAAMLLGTCYMPFGIVFDREIFANKKVYRSEGKLMLDMCYAAELPLKFLYVDRPTMPVIFSSVANSYEPFGYRMGPNA